MGESAAFSVELPFLPASFSVSAFAQDIELQDESLEQVFSDNYFSLLPGETKIIEAKNKMESVSVQSLYSDD